MNKWAEFYRVVVLRTASGDRQVTLRRPLVRTVVVPTVEDMKFDPVFIRPQRLGRIEYHWDGKETTVQGLPVYR